MNTSVADQAKRIQATYSEIRTDCVIVAACSAKYAMYLINAIESLDAKFTDRPRVIVYDIGLSRLQRAELRQMSGVELRAVPAFVPHWRLNWSWKLYALTYDLPRYVLYLDLPNFVALRSLAPWFVSIKKNGYFLLSNGQRMGDITPTDYWVLHGLDRDAVQDKLTFGAGIIGFDQMSSANLAIQKAMESTMLGMNLGRSATEKNYNYKPNIIRDCVCFRADQTLLNLAFRQVFGEGLLIRHSVRYCGRGAATDHENQFLWYARRCNGSLGYVFSKPKRINGVRVANQVIWLSKMSVVYIAKFLVKNIQRFIS